MKKIFTFSFILIIATFYVYVLFLALHPNVSKKYKFYFMSKKMYNWKNGHILDYTLGKSIDLAEKDSSNFSRKGWKTTEFWPGSICTFVKSSLPHVYFLYDTQKTPSKFIFTGSPLLLPSPYASITQTLKVYLNNNLISSEEYRGLKTVELLIPKDILSSNPEILDFRFEYDGPGYRKTTFGQTIGFCFTDIKLK